MKSSTKQKPSKTKLIVLAVLLCLLLLLVAAYFNDSSEDVVQPQTQQAQAKPPYKFGYMKARCEIGITNYSALLPQFQAESARIKVESDALAGSGDKVALQSYLDQLKSLKLSMETVTERVSKLKSCVESVDQKLEFTTSELADLNSYIDSSTVIPTGE